MTNPIFEEWKAWRNAPKVAPTEAERQLFIDEVASLMDDYFVNRHKLQPPPLPMWPDSPTWVVSIDLNYHIERHRMDWCMGGHPGAEEMHVLSENMLDRYREQGWYVCMGLAGAGLKILIGHKG